MIEDGLRRTMRDLAAGNQRWPLFLHGPVGTGKTCAALCLLDYSLGGGEYHTVSSICSLLIRAQQGRLEWSHEGRGGTVWPETLWQKLHAASLVILDEIGIRERASDHVYETVKELIDVRHRRPFIGISNIGPQDLARLYDDRIASRLASGTVVELLGKDRRIEQ